VKYKPVSDVFKKTPEKHTAKENKYHSGSSESQGIITVIKHISNYRNIHSPDHQGMGFGQHFQVIAFKQPGLALIVDFFKFHGAKIRKSRQEERVRKGWTAVER
jgi:hypothetical protein